MLFHGLFHLILKLTWEHGGHHPMTHTRKVGLSEVNIWPGRQDSGGSSEHIASQVMLLPMPHTALGGERQVQQETASFSVSCSMETEKGLPERVGGGRRGVASFNQDLMEESISL